MGISLIRINAIMSPLFGVCSGKVVAAERGAAQIEALDSLSLQMVLWRLLVAPNVSQSSPSGWKMSPLFGVCSEKVVAPEAEAAQIEALGSLSLQMGVPAF